MIQYVVGSQIYHEPFEYLILDNGEKRTTDKAQATPMTFNKARAIATRNNKESRRQGLTGRYWFAVEAVR